MKQRSSRAHVFMGALFLGVGRLAVAESPILAVDRIEPPSWWSAPSEQTLTLLIEGSGLKGSSITAQHRGVEVGRIDCAGDGSSLFVDIKLAAGLEPGATTLVVESGTLREERPWTILPRPTHRLTPIGPEDVIYLVLPDRFANGDPGNDSAGDAEPMLDRRDPHAYHGGDFAGLKAKLPYLADLGVTALWLTPVYRPGPKWFHTQINGQPRKFADFHGYSPVDFYDTNPHFGTQAEYRAVVDELHRIGLKLIQDQVLGYTGPQHRWVAKPPAPEWFHGPMDRPPPCTFRFDALTNPHAAESLRRGMTDGWFFGILPDLNMRDERVTRYAIQQSLWWTAMFAADGIRLDTYPMVDRSFWRDWTRARAKFEPRIRAIGEAWVTDAGDLSFFQGGRAGWDGLDPGVEAVFDFPLNRVLASVATKKAPAAGLGKALARDFLYPRPDLLVTFLDNHDTTRFAALPGVTAARHRLAAAFVLTARGIPQLTWGDEIGLPGDGNDRQSIPGAWPGDLRDAFTASGRSPEEQATFAMFRSLLHLRKATPALRVGTMVELAATDAVFAFVREHGGEKIVVVLNFGDAAERVPLPTETIGATRELQRLLGEGRATVTAEGAMVEIPAGRAGIFRVK